MTPSIVCTWASSTSMGTGRTGLPRGMIELTRAAMLGSEHAAITMATMYATG